MVKKISLLCLDNSEHQCFPYSSIVYGTIKISSAKATIENGKNE